jgi:hypothetical protein
VTAAPKRTTEPVCDLPMSVAVEELTGFEVIGIEKHFGVTLDALGGISTMIGAVWAYESRAAGKPVPWASVKAKTLRELTEYFAAEPDDVMPEDPDSELGKESSPDA